MQQEMAPEPNPRVVKAYAAMKELGISEDKTKPILKNLLKVYKNWELIEVENYRVLADMICESDDNKAEEERKNKAEEERKKRKDTQLSNDSEPQPKRLNSTKRENRPLLPSGRSQVLVGGSPLRKGGEREELSQSLIRRRVVKDESSELCSRGKSNEQKLSQTRTRGDVVGPKTVSLQTLSKERGKETVSSSQTYPRKDVAGASHDSPRGSRALSGSVSQQASQRVKGKEPISHQNVLRENNAVPRRVSLGVSFREPQIEHGKVMVHNDFHDNALMEQQSDDPQLEVPISIVRPLNQYPAAKEDGKDGGDFISPTRHSTELSLKLANISESSFSNFEIASSPLGEVRISLSCSSSTGRPGFHMPSLDAVLKLAGDKCLKSHKIINPNFSLVEVMEDLCQCFLGLSTSSTNDMNISRAGNSWKKMNSRAVIGSEGSHRAHNHMAGSSSNGLRNGLDDHHGMGSDRKVFECNGGRNKKKDQNSSESSNSDSLMLVQHARFNLDGERPIHNLDDISKGEERVKIPVVNQINSELYPPFFHYISKNTIYQNAYVNFSLARIGDEDSCSECFGDCVTSPIPCACARETGGVFAYTADGIVKSKFLDECILMRRDPPDHSLLYYCKDCPLERSKNGVRNCKGHFVRRFIKECWSKCGCDKQCGNRVVQRGITRTLQVFFTTTVKGWGVRTVEDLPRGAFVCEYVGEILTNTELYNRNQESTGNEKHTYPVLLDADWGSEGGLEDEEALCLDGTRFGNIARFINHRCYDANLVEIPVEIETPDRHYYHLAYFTSRAVPASEELTWDYGIDFHDVNHPVKAFRCRCGSKYCRDMPVANGTGSVVRIMR